jgi:hypothetical protein
MSQELEKKTELEKKILPIYHIYLVREREFVNNDKLIFKLGKSITTNFGRDNFLKDFKDLPKGRHLIGYWRCDDCDRSEDELLDIFRSKFKEKLSIGKKYFEGNPRDMMILIDNYFKIYKV